MTFTYDFRSENDWKSLRPQQRCRELQDRRQPIVKYFRDSTEVNPADSCRICCRTFVKRYIHAAASSLGKVIQGSGSEIA